MNRFVFENGSGTWIIRCLCIMLAVVNHLDCKWVDESVWTDKLGRELWDISNLVTKHAEIKANYINLNATVKDGKGLLSDIMKAVERMLKKKTKSVKCIARAAERFRKDAYFMNDFKLEYYNIKYSFGEGSDYSPTVPWELDELTEYKNMSLEPNPNFYNIPVNTSYSAVHIPTNVYDRYPALAETIAWSENLDSVFLKNYHSDPALSWQYFGSAHGMMRQFPAMQWNTNDNEVDLYDCRMRPWFIEAVTCTKDIVILMDNSGSMTGMRNTIAKLVVNSLLKTFGNNDFISVLRFSWKAESVLPCYKDMLVQATPEILRDFQEAVSHVKPEGNASFPNAFAYSLKLLQKYREDRIKNREGNCNQAIMLVTDGLPGNVTEVFEDLNVDENGLPIVRVFTYLVGTEVKGVEDLQLMACRNRGYYVHIHDLDEVHDQVLRYIPVIARPLVLQGNEHPVVWTHAFVDVNTLGEDKNIDYQEYRMMTSVSTPAFDQRETNTTKTAELLGVAGIDIPIGEIYSITYPYKTGTNGYIIITNNNGYLLMHPDLRPVYDGTLKLDYNSIDLAEVEFFDDAGGYKEFSSNVLNIRQSMVDQRENDFLGLRVKFHYDEMNRIGIEKRDFFIRPLPGTPFSICLVIPSDFAAYRIPRNLKVESNEVNFTSGLLEVDKYLKVKDSDERDMEWIVHPDWTYCKYHFHNHIFFESKEDELLHFLEKMGESDWHWNEPYDGKSEDKDECNERELNEDDYYCDQDLMELLLTDAQILESFRNPRIPKSSFERKLLDTYNPNLRFVATQSGLTKWQIIPKPKEGENQSSDFIEAFPRSVDEPWYKMAVLQHQVDEDSFVFSVSFKAGEADRAFVLAMHAIFHKKTHTGKKAPAAVVGYRFEQSSFRDRFMEITSDTDKFTLPCHSEARECFVLDHNGYIIVSSREDNETGKFFGESEGFVMSHLVELGIYEEKIIFDYQGLCIEEITVTNRASILKPWSYFLELCHYLIFDIFWNVMQMLSLQSFNIGSTYSHPSEDITEFRDYDSDESLAEEDEEEYEVEKEEFLNATVRIERKTWPCHKRKTLYLLKQNIFSEKHIYGVRHNSSRFRFVNRIPHTNMVIVVINTLYTDDSDIKLTTKAEVLPREDCRSFNILDLPRRRLSKCYTHHPEEMEVEACGGNQSIVASWILIVTCLLLLIKRNLFNK